MYNNILEQKIELAVMVAQKASYQASPTLPTSVGSVEMKNYRKGKKSRQCHMRGDTA